MTDKSKVLAGSYVGRSLADAPVAQLGTDGTLIIGQGPNATRQRVQMAPNETKELYRFLHEHFTKGETEKPIFGPIQHERDTLRNELRFLRETGEWPR